MGLEFQKKQVLLTGLVGVEEAENLLAWLQKKPGASADLSACEHLHPANLQVLMAARTPIKAWPADPLLASLLQSALAAPTPAKEQ
ncbi:hypothetical protein PSQ20_19335 [Curvibacter sp. RS43]|jgi:hypothetical protein|uniref:Uncharacterized protein n=1 Tax=Curvibacter microcysteis TaxID=3026419 RepID=A0ABT5MHB6_9BURK|nr:MULTISPECIES: hypothetical protein [unclassified Curvibacter]MDD0812509.1 hypothetical protein [Curvibacter sp. RS43]MDD0815982.1 hypothetical protein [Curvibacter sp. HBC28]